jgi:ElaB/YqjD/DUF883 family membrane-anchored ribosome-binding protein
MQTSNLGSPEEIYPASANAGKVGQDVRQFAGEVERLAGEAKQLSNEGAAVEGAAVARAKLDDTVSQAKAKLAAASNAAAEQGRRSIAATEGYVHEHPLTAIVAAVAIGVVLGLLMRRS